MATPSPSGSSEYLSKVLVVGEVGVGKTSIIKRYLHNLFSDGWKTTVGVDFGLKVLQYDPQTTINLQLWDIAGQERFSNMTRVYYKDASAAIIVFDVTRVATFQAVKKWKDDIDNKVTLANGKRLPVILLANKIDLSPEALSSPESKEQMEKYCKENGFLSWMDTSAKDDTNVSDAIMKLVHEVVKNIKDIQSDNKNKKYMVDPDESSPIIKLTSENNTANGVPNNNNKNNNGTSGHNGKAVNVAGSGIRPGTPNGNVKSNGDGCAC
jgi:small GTP-binding protein